MACLGFYLPICKSLAAHICSSLSLARASGERPDLSMLVMASALELKLTSIQHKNFMRVNSTRRISRLERAELRKSSEFSCSTSNHKVAGQDDKALKAVASTTSSTQIISGEDTDRSFSESPARKAIVVGAGVGGLCVATRLARAGLDVTIVEKNEQIGGRLNSTFEEGGFRFDTGPSLLLMPEVYREAFSELGEELTDHLELRRVEPAAYRVFFSDRAPGAIDMLYDVQAMCCQLEGIESGAGSAYLRFLAYAKEALDKGTENFIAPDFRSFWDYVNLPRLLPLLRKLSPLDLLGQHDWRMKSYFQDPRLRALFTFQDLYVGLSPYNAPGVFSLLAATELTAGVWYPAGGFGTVRDALLAIAQKNGVRVLTGAPVAQVLAQSQKMEGVLLEDGRRLHADIVVMNADLPYAVANLLPGRDAKVRAKRLARLKYSAGVIAFHWSLTRQVDALIHHNVFLSDEYNASWQRAVDPESLRLRPNFYVHAPQRTDPSAAPPGGDAITVLLPVANLGEVPGGGQAGTAKMAELVTAARAAILARMAEAGCGDLTNSIAAEQVCSPVDWRQLYNLQHGAAFGLAHNLSQLAYFRPDVADSHLAGLYYVGASTRPGNGVPLVLMGAKTTSSRILADLDSRN